MIIFPLPCLQFPSSRFYSQFSERRFSVPLSECNFNLVSELLPLSLYTISRSFYTKILEENGFHCKILKNFDKGILKIFDIGKRKFGPGIIGYGLINRLLYECLSVKTFVDYVKEVSEKLMKEKILK